MQAYVLGLRFTLSQTAKQSTDKIIHRWYFVFHNSHSILFKACILYDFVL